jgi:hypothetical protein
MSTITAYGHEANGLPPIARLGAFGAFLRHALASFGPSRDDCYAPRPRQSRHEATIAAARCALGGTVEW